MKPENVSVLIIDPDQQAQAAVRMALNNLGYRVFYVVASREEAEAVLNDGPVELIFTEADLADGPGGHMIRTIRHGNLGQDPFVPIIATLSVADPALVRAIVDDGPDDVLIKPLSTDAIASRVERIIKNRKPFVVTRDYMGPDRRAKAREDSAAAPAYDVPNRLKDVFLDTLDEGAWQAAVRTSMSELMDMRIASQAKAIVFVLDRALPDWLIGEVAADAPAKLREVFDLAAFAVDVIENTGFADQADTFRTLYTMVQTIGTDGPAGLSRHLGDLQEVNTTLKKAFKTG